MKIGVGKLKENDPYIVERKVIEGKESRKDSYPRNG